MRTTAAASVPLVASLDSSQPLHYRPLPSADAHRVGVRSSILGALLIPIAISPYLIRDCPPVWLLVLFVPAGVLLGVGLGIYELCAGEHRLWATSAILLNLLAGMIIAAWALGAH